MVRERISTSGVIRPLEPPSELAGCNVPLDKICRINEKSAKRYIEGLTAWDKKFGKMAKRIAKERDSNLRLAKQNAPRYIGRLVSTIGRHESRNAKEDGKKPEEEEGESTVLGSPNWSWTWALEGEDPPPSSIVARLDTKEALRLARVADKGFEDTETRMSGNNLWANIMEFLTAGPEHPPQKTPTSSPPRPTKQDIIVTPKPHHSDSSATVVPEGAPQGTAPALGGVLLSSSKLLGGVRRRREEAAKAAGASPSLSTDLETEPV